MHENLVALLEQHKLTLSTAESCTGGLISKLITDVAGCSDVYIGGVCSYSNDAKEKFLGVKHETLIKYGAVSEQVSREMAIGIKNKTNSDVSISTTGIAGPGGGSKDKPVGLVYITVCVKNNVKTIRLNENPTLTRSEIRKASANKAISLAAERIIASFSNVSSKV